MFLGVLNTVFLNIYNYLPYLELKDCSIQSVIKTNFVVILDVGIMRFDSTRNYATTCTMAHNSLHIKAVSSEPCSLAY